MQDFEIEMVAVRLKRWIYAFALGNERTNGLKKFVNIQHGD